MRTIRVIKQRLSNDEGLTTAEYAVGTVAAVGLGGLLIKLITSDGIRDLLWGLFQRALSSIFG
jgi:hypothetical protein